MNCPSEKIQYESDTQALAYAAAFNIGKYAHRQKTMRAYLCEHCEFWHCASRNKKKTCRRRKAQMKRAKERERLALYVWEGEGGA